MIHTKLLKFQKMGITLKKDGTNPHFGSSYSTLNEVLDKVKEPLNALGILILQNPEKDGLRTILLDTEDETKVESFMPYVETSTAQKLGSNNTYVRRYALVTMLGLEDADDDGNEASRPRSTLKSAPQRTEPLNIDPRVPIINMDEPNSDPFKKMCACGKLKVYAQKKSPGDKQGQWYFACPQPRGKQCPNEFEWDISSATDTDFTPDREGDKELDYDPATGALRE